MVAGFFGFKTSAPHFIYILFRIITPMKSCGQNQSSLVAQYVRAELGRTEAGPMGTRGTAANDPQSYRVGDRPIARARSELKRETATQCTPFCRSSPLLRVRGVFCVRHLVSCTRRGATLYLAFKPEGRGRGRGSAAGRKWGERKQGEKGREMGMTHREADHCSDDRDRDRRRAR